MLEEADGVKTGTTNEAGPCLVSSATSGNQRFIAVVLHDHSRWYDSMQLLQYGFRSFDLFEYADAGQYVGTITVERGADETVDVHISQQAAIVIKPDDVDQVTVELDLPEKITAPVYEGQKIGEVIFYIHDRAVKTVDIVASSNVAERTISTAFLGQLLEVWRIIAGWGLM